MTELLVVLAVISILAAILFPVFRAAKSAANRTVCASSFRQVQTATMLYLADYDERFPLVNYNVEAVNDPSRDRTWVQLLMPYLRSFSLFTCPADHGDRPRPETLFDGDLVLGDTYRRYYRASLRSNLGYNYLYFSPVYRQGNSWQIVPRSTSEISDATSSIMFVDSVYDRRRDGTPYGGGSYIVIPPCRYARSGSARVDTFNIPPTAQVYSPNQGWRVTVPFSPFRYGLAWPWHDGRMNVGITSGGTKPVATPQLHEGCDVRDNWGGLIVDSRYPWDTD